MPIDKNHKRQNDKHADNSIYVFDDGVISTDFIKSSKMVNMGCANMNPPGISLLKLIREDYITHDKKFFEPGFWAVALHRYGNWRMSIKPKFLRFPFSLLYSLSHFMLLIMWGIELPYTVILGRRVRVWHHGCIFIGARSIGDDVHIRHNTTIGLLHRQDAEEPWKKPIIEDRVDIGSGACILGDIVIGHDSVIGANSVVVRDFPPNSTLFGIPARRVNISGPGDK